MLTQQKEVDFTGKELRGRELGVGICQRDGKSLKKMLGSKAANYDTYGLLRCVAAPTISTTYEQAHVVLDLLTLVS